MSGGLKKLLVNWQWLSKLLRSTATSGNSTTDYVLIRFYPPQGSSPESIHWEVAIKVFNWTAISCDFRILYSTTEVAIETNIFDIYNTVCELNLLGCKKSMETWIFRVVTPLRSCFKSSGFCFIYYLRMYRLCGM